MTKDVPAGKLAVGVPARIREPRAKPADGMERGRERVVNLPITQLLVIVFLTLLEAFFVAAEIALVSVRRSRIDQLVEEGNSSARRVRRLLDEPGRFLAVSQLGLTFIGFFASAFAAVSLADSLATVLVGAGHGPGDRVRRCRWSSSRSSWRCSRSCSPSSCPRRSRWPTPSGTPWRCRCPIDFLARALGPVVAALTGITNAIVGLFGAGSRTRPRSPPRSCA